MTRDPLWKLRRRAEKLDLRIIYDRKNDGFILVDPVTNVVAAYPTFMTLEQVEEWLDELEKDGNSND